MNKIKIYSNIVIFLEIPTFFLLIISLYFSISFFGGLSCLIHKSEFKVITSKVDSIGYIPRSGGGMSEIFFTKIHKKYFEIENSHLTKQLLLDAFKNRTEISLVFNENSEPAFLNEDFFWENFKREKIIQFFFLSIPYLFIILIRYAKRQLKILAPYGVDDNYQPLKNPKEEGL